MSENFYDVNIPIFQRKNYILWHVWTYLVSFSDIFGLDKSIFRLFVHRRHEKFPTFSSPFRSFKKFSDIFLIFLTLDLHRVIISMISVPLHAELLQIIADHVHYIPQDWLKDPRSAKTQKFFSQLYQVKTYFQKSYLEPVPNELF